MFYEIGLPGVSAPNVLGEATECGRFFRVVAFVLYPINAREAVRSAEIGHGTSTTSVNPNCRGNDRDGSVIAEAASDLYGPPYRIVARELRLNIAYP